LELAAGADSDYGKGTPKNELGNFYHLLAGEKQKITPAY